MRDKILEKIDTMNERLKQLKLQGESSRDKTLKNLRHKRNKLIKELVDILTPETNYYKLNFGKTKEFAH